MEQPGDEPGCFGGRERVGEGGQAGGLDDRALGLKAFSGSARWEYRDREARQPVGDASGGSVGGRAHYQQHSAPGLMRTRRREWKYNFSASRGVSYKGCTEDA